MTPADQSLVCIVVRDEIARSEAGVLMTTVARGEAVYRIENSIDPASIWNRTPFGIVD